MITVKCHGCGCVLFQGPPKPLRSVAEDLHHTCPGCGRRLSGEPLGMHVKPAEAHAR